jgi:hypothetical protein
MTAHAWSIAASKFIEVATGREKSPFDFGDCGYLRPRPDVDIGVELRGEPLFGAGEQARTDGGKVSADGSSSASLRILHRVAQRLNLFYKVFSVVMIQSQDC